MGDGTRKAQQNLKILFPLAISSLLLIFGFIYNVIEGKWWGIFCIYATFLFWLGAIFGRFFPNPKPKDKPSLFISFVYRYSMPILMVIIAISTAFTNLYTHGGDIENYPYLAPHMFPVYLICYIVSAASAFLGFYLFHKQVEI